MTLLWSADLSQTDVVAAGFADDNFNRQTNAGDGAASGLPWPMPVTAAPDGVRATQAFLPSLGKRDELVPNVAEFTGGENYYFGQSLYAPAGFDMQATAGSGFQVIQQMRQDDDTGSPVVAFELRNGGLLISGGYGILGASPDNEYQYQQTLVATVSTGVRHTLVCRIGPFSATPGTTTVDVWFDGTQVLTGFTVPPPTIVGTGATAWKCGLYRDPANTTAETLWQAAHALGTTYADVTTAPSTVTGAATVLPAIRGGSFLAAV